MTPRGARWIIPGRGSAILSTRIAIMIHKPYLLFLGDVEDFLAAKTAAGIAHWRPDDCVGQRRLPGCRADLGLQDLDIEQALASGAKTVIVGVANSGGFLPDHWVEELERALAAGLDLASGLHQRLSDVPRLADLAARHGRRLHDVRQPRTTLRVGTGAPRAGRRLLTVGTDCSVGKMYAALALERGLRARGVGADFRATGQTGIFIAGEGISVDAVVADFISGAVEALAPANAPQHWDLIEGQGSLFHPAFAGVSLGLLHGAQPEALVLCHEPTRAHMRGLPAYPLPGLQACIDANLQAARLTSPEVRMAGVCINTSGLDETAARRLLEQTSEELALPCVDPVREGVEALLDTLG